MGTPCGITECPRNKLGECELSDLPEGNPDYREPDRCGHRLFKLRQIEEDRKHRGESK